MQTTETPNLETIAQTLGLTLTSSKPRPYIDKDWRAIAYDCVLLRNGKSAWEGEYKMGVGNVTPKHWKRVNGWVDRSACNRNGVVLRPHDAVIRMIVQKPGVQFRDPDAHVRAAVAVAGVLGIKPALEDVLSSLITDGEPDFQGLSFDDWCSEFGYDSDSRKAHATYDACCEVGRRLRRAFTPEELQTLTETLANY